jgi:hypothetical protein
MTVEVTFAAKKSDSRQFKNGTFWKFVDIRSPSCASKEPKVYSITFSFGSPSASTPIARQ